MNSMREHRTKRDLSMGEMSKITGLSERYLRFIEMGEKTPSLKTAKKIADTLDSTVDEIFLSKKCTKSTQ